MKWDKRLRLLSWIFFALMWIAVIWYIVVSQGYEGIDDPRILPFFAFLGLFLTFQAGAVYVDRLEKERIRTAGIPAKATVISCESTGRLVMNRPELRIELEVQPPWGIPFTATTEHIVPYPDLFRVEPGKTVNVYFLDGSGDVTLADL